MNRLPRSCSLHTDAAGFAPPDAFGPFRVLHQVGAGTLGPVFRAYDADRDRLVAVKLFRLDLPPDRLHQLVARLERLIAAPLAHPAIVAPIATGTDGIILYLVQDFVAAESLDVVVRDHGPAAPAGALRMAAELAEALDGADMKALRDAFARALAPHPDDRFETALDFAAALKGALPQLIVEREPLLPLDDAPPPAPSDLPRMADLEVGTTGDSTTPDSPDL